MRVTVSSLPDGDAGYLVCIVGRVHVTVSRLPDGDAGAGGARLADGIDLHVQRSLLCARDVECCAHTHK